MQTRHPTTWWLASLITMVILAETPATAATPAQNCQAAKNKEAGKYDGCRLNAEAKFATSLDGVKLVADQAKCLAKYQAKWLALEAKALALGGPCPSVGDQAAIQGVIVGHTTNIAAALGGGVLQDCTADLTVCERGLATCEAALSGTPGIPLKTGQTTCYDAAGTVIACAGTGQDGEFQKGLARSYTDNGNGTITDNRTGLVWEKLSDDGSIHDKDTSYTWTTAVTTKVAALNSGSFAGFTDWRVPNRAELESIVNLGAVGPSVFSAFNTSCAASCTVLTCSCTQSNFYWSSSTYQDSPSFAWDVNFYDGSVLAGNKTNNGYVRAVRGGS